jgi:hypothetical protein
VVVALNSLFALLWGRSVRIENTRFTVLLLGLLAIWLLHGAVRFALHP